MTETDKPVRVRIAPSPTGLLHIGTLRTTLTNWLFARKNKGVFIVRIEDTDPERSKPEYEKDILEGFTWAGLDWDEGPTLEGGSKGDYGPYRQSERAQHYRPYLEKLLEEGKAYYCYCTKDELEAQKQSLQTEGLAVKYNGHCRQLEAPPAGREPQVVRLKNSDIKIKFKDLIRATVEFDTSLFGDMIIARNLDSALYNFAVVVDDHEMKVSHVIRGEDHIANTPKQILIQQALGFETPIYGHIPLILNADRSKLSKRSNQTSAIDYKKQGYLPEALINYLALLGWHPSDNEEVFTTAELIEKYDLKRIQKAGAIWDIEKLRWLNHEHIKRLSTEALIEHLRPFIGMQADLGDKKLFHRIVESVKERLYVLTDFPEEASFYFEVPAYEASLLVWKTEPTQKSKEMLETLREKLSAIEENEFEQTMKNPLEELAAHYGKGNVYWPLRVALSGKKASPGPIEIAQVLGKQEVLKRLDSALEKLAQV